MDILKEQTYDVVIVGAGFSGIHQLIHLLRLGLRCIIVETGSDLGGTWYWNRYPGARVDSQIPIYEFSLPELWQEWTWSEKFPNWKELQTYFTYVADKLDLRQYCLFDTTVKKAHWDNDLHVWHVSAEGKEGIYKATARYLNLCMGVMSKPYIPDIKGLDSFKGSCCHTSRWPKEGIEMAGKRVGIIGSGSSAVQVIQEIGPQVSNLTIYQRTPNLALPMGQYSVTKQVQDHFKPVYTELYKKLDTTFTGATYENIPKPMPSVSDEEREATFERLWKLGGFNFSMSNYQDLLRDRASNDKAYEFWRRKVSQRIKDPAKRELLAPAVPPHPLGCKRQCLEQNFYEILNEENVDLVDINATPIIEISENGLKTTQKEYEFDVLVLATGFDGFVGGFNDIDLRGLNGRTIQDHWRDGVSTYLGMTIDNFPNLFFMYGPQAPTAISNGPTCLQLQGAWIVQTISYLRQHHITKFTPTSYAASSFKKHVDELGNAITLLSQTDSWYTGANIPGKKRETYNYIGGIAAYKQEIMEEVERGYPGFQREVLSV